MRDLSPPKETKGKGKEKTKRMEKEKRIPTKEKERAKHHVSSMSLKMDA